MTDQTNPKAEAATRDQKAPLDLLEFSADVETALALLTGAKKYGKKNYRTIPVFATTYGSAIKRHVGAWLNEQNLDPESGLNHLAHIGANIHVLFGAMEAGTFVDDRGPEERSEEQELRSSASNQQHSVSVQRNCVTDEPLVPGDLTNMIELYSGKFLDLSNPNYKDISITDIAHGLSLTCRFSGQCSVFYSVAEHAILVSQCLEDYGYDARMQLAGLHHDDAEAFITDVPRPLKPLIHDYSELEEDVLDAALSAVGLANLPVHDDAVKGVDAWALAQEAGELMPSSGARWNLGHKWDGTCRYLGVGAPNVVEASWLKRHTKLVESL